MMVFETSMVFKNLSKDIKKIGKKLAKVRSSGQRTRLTIERSWVRILPILDGNDGNHARIDSCYTQSWFIRKTTKYRQPNGAHQKKKIVVTLEDGVSFVSILAMNFICKINFDHCKSKQVFFGVGWVGIENWLVLKVNIPWQQITIP